jgi:hypothetical protein
MRVLGQALFAGPRLTHDVTSQVSDTERLHRADGSGQSATGWQVCQGRGKGARVLRLTYPSNGLSSAAPGAAPSYLGIRCACK